MFENCNCNWKQFNLHLPVVGNKADLPKRDVSTKDGGEKGLMFNIPYVETSAKTKQGVVSFSSFPFLQNLISWWFKLCGKHS